LVCTCLLHHLPQADSALKEWRRVVRVGGTLSLYLPCDPGMLYRAARWGTTHRYQRKLERAGRLDDHLYLWAREHPNHVLGLRQLIRVNFACDYVRRRIFPFPWLSWNFNFYEIYDIRIAAAS
jgi:SAM-dependent methyltransferase